jgi:hypothetical protein
MKGDERCCRFPGAQPAGRGSVIHLVLNASVAAVYGVDVGETLAEVHGNGARFAVPLARLAASGVDPHLVGVLLGHAAFDPYRVPFGKYRACASAFDLLGCHDRAEAIAAAILLNGDVLTAEPEAYAAFRDQAPIIAI